MTTEVNNILDAIVAGWNQKDWELLKSVHAADWVDLSVSGGSYNLDSMREFFGMFTSSFPDMEMEIIDSIVNQHQAAYFYQVRGTHQKALLGIPASGRRIAFDGMMMLNIEHGKIASARGVTDRMSMFDQLRSDSRQQ